RTDAAFAMAVAGGFHAAEWEVHLGADCRSVDIRDAGIEVAHRSERLVYILCVEGRRQTVLDVVGDGDGVFDPVAGNDRNYRPKDFFLRNPHLGVDFRENSRFEEPAVLVDTFVEPVAS